uniref:Uncharacterized protein n=1 Tax=Oryza brachyantha TaxID=4533 RepID=J3KYK2_ORYBR
MMAIASIESTDCIPKKIFITAKLTCTTMTHCQETSTIPLGALSRLREAHKKLILAILFLQDPKRSHFTIYEPSPHKFFINPSEKGGESTLDPLWRLIEMSFKDTWMRT